MKSIDTEATIAGRLYDIYYKLKVNALTEARKYTWDKAAQEYKKIISELRAF